ncbi:MAG TPA: peroxiredoxin [Kofleriaceae bacterium]|nr:peroxiredoxin [Kofleriaceae bacterium]
MLKVGQEAPDFAADTTTGSRFALRELRGRWVVLYFFPKAFTPGCSLETRRFQHMLPDLRAWNAEVVGISSDEHDRQCDFARSLEIGFALVSDPDGAIARLYEARRPLVSFVRRITYVIDPDGRVAACFHHELAVKRHEQEVREFLEAKLGPAPSPPPA